MPKARKKARLDDAQLGPVESGVTTNTSVVDTVKKPRREVLSERAGNSWNDLADSFHLSGRGYNSAIISGVGEATSGRGRVDSTESSSSSEEESDIRSYSNRCGLNSDQATVQDVHRTSDDASADRTVHFLEGFKLTYPSWSDFFEALNAFCCETYQVFSKCTSKSVLSRNKQIRKRQQEVCQPRSQTVPFPVEMEKEPYSISFWCTHARNRPSDSTGKRDHTTLRGTECPAKISARITRSGSSGFCIVVSSQGTAHNHRVDKMTYNQYPENRAIDDPSVLATVDAMRVAGAKARGILLYLRDLYDEKMTTLKDIHNLMARLKAQSKLGDTEHECVEAVLRNLCSTDQGAVASVYVDEKRTLDTVAFQSCKMRRLFAAFPEVLLVDTTFGTNINRYKLFSFVVHDINGKLLLLNRLRGGKNHPLFKYFVKNWDDITDEWVSYQRANVPHLGNNTNNRIEAKWAKLKDLIRPSASVDECIATLLGLQGICENEYAVELNKVGTTRIPNDREYDSMDDDALGELKRLANLVSSYAFSLINSEFKLAHRLSTRYKLCVRENAVVELARDDDPKVYHLSLKDFSCSCMFAQTRLLPCHAFYYRRCSLSVSATKYESTIPFSYINTRWCTNQELNDISISEDTQQPTTLQYSTSSAKKNPKSPRQKYKEAKRIMSDLTEILQSMGSDRFDTCLEALKRFKDVCVEGQIPNVVPADNFQPVPAAYEDQTINQDLYVRDSTRSSVSEGQHNSVHGDESRANQVPEGLLPPSSTHRTENQEAEVLQVGAGSGFTLSQASKSRGKSKKTEKRVSKRGTRISDVKKAADILARGFTMPQPSLSTVQVLLDQQYSYNLCFPVFNSFKRIALPRGEVHVTFKSRGFVFVDVDFTLDKDGVQRCSKAIEAFADESGLAPPDDDDLEEMVVYADGSEVFQATQIATMEAFHRVSSVLKVVERAMDWVCRLPENVFEGIMPGFEEFVTCDKTEHNVAIGCCKLKGNRIDGGDIVFADKLMEFCGNNWLNSSCILMGILFLRRKFPRIGFVSPTFTQLAPEKSVDRLADAGRLGCFRHLANGSAVAGVLHVTTDHWTSFIYYPYGSTHTGDHPGAGKPTCIIYDCGKGHYSETAELVRELLVSQNHSDITFVADTMTRQFDGFNCGPLSLLFLETQLNDSTRWTKALPGSLQYYRLRYLRHSLSLLSE